MQGRVGEQAGLYPYKENTPFSFIFLVKFRFDHKEEYNICYYKNLNLQQWCLNFLYFRNLFSLYNV